VLQAGKTKGAAGGIVINVMGAFRLRLLKFAQIVFLVLGVKKIFNLV
jgi:hypothetical protein